MANGLTIKDGELILASDANVQGVSKKKKVKACLEDVLGREIEMIDPLAEREEDAKLVRFTILDLIVNRVVKQAVNGDLKAAQLIFDRVDGKIANEIPEFDVTQPDRLPIKLGAKEIEDAAKSLEALERKFKDKIQGKRNESDTN